MTNDTSPIVHAHHNKKQLIAMAVLVAAAGLLASIVAFNGRALAVLGGPSCNVPGDYLTIQMAVNTAGCNTVRVAPGAYAENVTLTRTVNLKGAKAGMNVSGRTFNGAGESTITGLVTVSAANVTVDGFSITNPGQGGGVVVTTAGSGSVIKNNIVDTIGSASYPDNGVGIYLAMGPDNVKVLRNRINNVQSVKSAQGMLVGDSTSNDPSLGIRITGNTITNVTSTRGGYGIQVNNGTSTSASGYATVKIQDNTVSGLTGSWVHAIGLEGDTPNAVVTGNTISGLNSAGIDRVAVWFEDNSFFFTADVSRNSLDVKPGAGIYVHPALTTLYPTLSVDGACNWWGSKTGPDAVAAGTGSYVGPGVDYSPWLKSSNLNARCGDGERHHEDDDNHHGGHDND